MSARPTHEFRTQLDLNGLWRFQADPFDEGRRLGYAGADFDARKWREVSVPTSFDRCGNGLETYEGPGWFMRQFVAPEKWRGKRVVVRFLGVNYSCEVWINGHSAGAHPDGFLGFEFSVEDAVVFGGTNVLAVRVDSTRRAGEVPGLERGWRTFGGILREVELEASEHMRLESIGLVTDAAGRVAVDAEVANDRAESQTASIEVTIADSNGEQRARFVASPERLDPGSVRTFRIEGSVEGAMRWTPSAPTMYAARVTLSSERSTVDVRAERFGFRTIETRGTELLLNGDPIHLLGFNRHEDSPRTGMCTDLATARADLTDMKRHLGCNFVRLCHYPHHPGELDLCDELGLLAMCEIPLYWWNGTKEGEENYARKLAAAKRQLRSMIRRDRNHPSVIVWSVSNETHEDRPEVASGNAELVCLAREMDPTRPATHVSDHFREDLHFEEDDIICLNSYPSQAGRHRAGERDFEWADAGESWRNAIAKIRAFYPDKPILVTEFGYPSFEGAFGASLGEDAQGEAIQAEFAAMTPENVCGAVIWCYADHPWPEEPFISYVTTSPYGVVTRDRRRLAAYHVVKRIFEERSGAAKPPDAEEPVTSVPESINMVRADMRDIPRFPLPDGFTIRPMHRGEGALWSDIQRDAGTISAGDHDAFCNAFGDDLPATERRCFFVVAASGAAVGTVSAWFSRDFRGQDWGRIHWVAVRPAFHGKKLGKAAVSHAMEYLAAHHDRAWLDTQTYRLIAVKMYLGFGFRPDLEPPRALESWRVVAEKLDNPALADLR